MTDKERIEKLELALRFAECALKDCCMNLDLITSSLNDLRDKELGVNQPRTPEELERKMMEWFGAKPLSQYYYEKSLTITHMSDDELKQPFNNEVK